MMRLSTPAAHAAPLRWLGECVFKRMLGIEVEIVTGEHGHFELSHEQRSLRLANVFLAAGDDGRAAPLPDPPLAALDPAHYGGRESDYFGSLPVLFGEPAIETTATTLDCQADILGGVFFMLSRAEETLATVRDTHDRFPASASLAARAGFLERPLVDEYVQFLWTLMKRLWPGLERRRTTGRTRVTCDIDVPFDCQRVSAARCARAAAGDLLRRRDPRTAARRIASFAAYRRDDHRQDPNFTFDWYMDECERAGQQATFYVIPENTAGAIDGCYKLEDRPIRSLLGEIGRRGHAIGTHGSYATYRDGRQIERERDRLRHACASLGIAPPVAGNRQHYLRWDTAETPDHLDAAGYAYDSTGGYADAAGFRFGTAHAFPMWSWRQRAGLALLQVPLVAMDTTLFSPAYMGLSHTPEALDRVRGLRDRALHHGGDFTLLWHNSSLRSDAERNFFRQLLS